jgi:hypothetical protein
MARFPLSLRGRLDRQQRRQGLDQTLGSPTNRARTPQPAGIHCGLSDDFSEFKIFRRCQFIFSEIAQSDDAPLCPGAAIQNKDSLVH